MQLDEVRNVIIVEYDFWKVTYDEDEKWLMDSTIVLSKGLFDRWKRGWVKFFEQIELDNFSATPTSCCDDSKNNGAHCKGR